MSYNKLRGKIKEVFGPQDSFASALGMNPSTLSAKLTGKTDWNRREVELACQVLGIPMEEMHLYFFSPTVA